MRFTRFWLAGSTLGMLLTSVALAQNADPTLRQPGTIQRTAFQYDDYLSWAPEAGPSASPSDKPAAPKAEAPAPAAAEPGSVAGCATACGSAFDPVCGNGCGGNGCGEKKCRWCACGKLAEPWKLPMPCALKCHDIVIGGWLSGGVYSNAYGDVSNGPLGFRNLSTGSADQLWLYGEKKVNTKDSVFDWGFRTDFLFGMDGPKTQAFGDQSWDFDWDSSRDYGSALPQAYVELGWNDLSVKAGRFYTPIGYEIIPATGRFFYSHSYTCFYAEPFTHTGMLGTYKMSDKMSASLGWVDGWDNGYANRNGASQVIGGLNWTPGERFTLAWYFTAGRNGNGTYGGANGDLYFNSIVATLKMTEKLTYVFQHDYGYNYDLPGDTTAEWYGINQYLLYKLNDCWSVGGRFEWFRDDDGARVTGDGLGRTIANPGNYYEVACGLNYKPHANVTIRPEIRYDTYEGPIVNQRPFDRGQATNQISGGFDVIFTY